MELRGHIPKRIWLTGAVVALMALILTPLSVWSQRGKTQARSLSNLRRIAQGTLLYTQDWDGRTMPFVQKFGGGKTLTWAQTLQGYGVNPDVFSNPANPLRSPLPTDPQRGTTVNTAYALNRRLWDTFAPGAFPLDNLEIPERTVLAVEAGNAWQQPSHAGTISAFAALTYGDTTDRIQGAIPYISPHGGRMAVVAIDGHTVLVKVAHYDNSLPHDTLYGRLGGTIYNWNGGYLNGQTDKPNRE
jgi:hypothetical protein